jgi:hypothetical protein
MAVPKDRAGKAVFFMSKVTSITLESTVTGIINARAQGHEDPGAFRHHRRRGSTSRVCCTCRAR